MAFTIKENDLLPVLDATLSDANGVFDLTGIVGVLFVMNTSPNVTPPKVAAAATVVNAAGGQVRYSWAGTDTDTPGNYKGEFEVEVSGGKRLTFPNNGYIDITIVPDLNSDVDPEL
jgi:hypothetical protein